MSKVTILHHNQNVIIEALRCYVGSTVGYVLQCNSETDNPELQRNPIVAYRMAEELNQPNYWINRAPVVIADAAYHERENKEVWEKAPCLSVGDRVMLDGVEFLIALVPDKNFKLVRQG